MAALKAGGAAQSPAAASTGPSPSITTNDDRRHDAPTPRFSTTLGNKRTESPLPATKSQQPASKQQGEDEPLENKYWDPKSSGTSRDRMTRRLLFNQRGKYLEQASRIRRQTKLEEIKALLAKQNRQAKLDENSERGFLVQPPPDIEWWDEGILEDKTYECIDNPSKVKIDGEDSIITSYVQHPVLVKPPQEQLLVQIKPMYLTQKEQAKIRRMRRAEEHKEQQAKIRLGLEPPPPPKVKRGNMMRVMGEQAIADPTAVEMLVEQQIQERHDKHIQANEERKLTKEERRAKLAENQKKDAQKGLYMCVFKVESFAFGKHRYQVDLNAKEHAFTGVTIFNPKMNLVIVEGGHWSMQKYKRLMLNRIRWSEITMPTEAQIEKQAADPGWLKPLDERGDLKDLSSNKCTLVFEGEVKQRAFRKWGSKICESDGEAKELLGKAKLDSLWGLAARTE
jgi:U4/U6 small nuclear ribonucleoprotein PRP3